MQIQLDLARPFVDNEARSILKVCHTGNVGANLPFNWNEFDDVQQTGVIFLSQC